MAPLNLLCSVLLLLHGVLSAKIDALKLGKVSRPRQPPLLGFIAPRQSSAPGGGVGDVPAQCATNCDPVNDILETGTCPPSECCTPLFEAAYYNCLLCVGQADNATKAEFAQAQTLVDNLIVDCSDLGFVLPDLTLPGQNSSRIIPTSTFASNAKSSNTISQITITSVLEYVPPLSTTMTTKEQAPVSKLHRLFVGAYTVGGVVCLSAFPSVLSFSTEWRYSALCAFILTLWMYFVVAGLLWTADAKNPMAMNMRLLQAICFLVIILVNSDLFLPREPLRALGVPEYLIIAVPATCAGLAFRLIFKWWGETYWDPAALQDKHWVALTSA
uniref:Extracellular membrane protein CFEM domain-containing protein n=1 Tax=Mycena chlorophos TaxID=658473 RepID=A0ABQ0L4S9_MYCCL|nr:predicted protein [Mycena chlorophos]